MYAIIETGGKQYKVSEKETITIEKLEAEKGAEVTFDKVLVFADGDSLKLGQPTVAGASVTGKVVAQERGERVRVFKFKKRKGYRKAHGHRQYLTRVIITKILG
jgi:large subunit ribosomal protein L21